MGRTTNGITTYGSREIISVGVEALEAAREIAFLGEDVDIAEVSLAEGGKVRMTLTDDAGHHYLVWDGHRWTPEETGPR